MDLLFLVLSIFFIIVFIKDNEYYENLLVGMLFGLIFILSIILSETVVFSETYNYKKIVIIKQYSYLDNVDYHLEIIYDDPYFLLSDYDEKILFDNKKELEDFIDNEEGNIKKIKYKYYEYMTKEKKKDEIILDKKE